MSDERPDPADVEPIDADEHVHQRDADGNLIPEDDVVKVRGEWRRVKRKPPTRGLLQQIETEFGGRAEVEFNEIDALLSQFYDEPDYDDSEWADVDPALYLALMNRMVEVVQGDEDDITADLAAAVEERQEGNPA